MRRWQEHSWVLTIPVAAVAVAYVWFFFLPDKRIIAEQRSELEQKLAFCATSAKIGADISRAQREIEETDAYTRHWSVTSGDPAHIAAVYKSIAETAKESDVQTTRFVPDPIVKLASLERQPLRFGCRGDLESIFEMLAGLEQLNDRIWIDELVLEPTGKDDELVQCDMVLAIFASNPEK